MVWDRRKRRQEVFGTKAKVSTKTNARTSPEVLKHLTLELTPLNLAKVPEQVLSMAWLAPGEFGLRRSRTRKGPATAEDRVRHHRDHVWPTRERFVNQVLSTILLAVPPKALAAATASIAAKVQLRSPLISKASTRKLGKFVGQPDFVMLDEASRSVILGEIKIDVTDGNHRYSFEQYTKYMLLSALLRTAGLAERVAHIIVVPDARPREFCRDHRKWKPSVEDGCLVVAPDRIPLVRRRIKVLYSDRASWVKYAEEFLSRQKVQQANRYDGDAIAALRLPDKAPALCPSYVVTWQQLAAALDTACKATGAGHLGMAIEVMRKMAMGESR